MQHKLLRVGAEYLVNRAADWRKYDSGSRRVRLLSTNRFVESQRGVWSMKPYTYTASSQGRHVRVVFLDPETGIAMESLSGDRYVDIRHIRGTWQEARTEQAETRRSEDAAREAHLERRIVAEKAAETLQEQALRLGVSVNVTWTGRNQLSPERSFVLTSEELRKLLGRLADVSAGRATDPTSRTDGT